MVLGLADTYFARARERLEKSDFIVLHQDHGTIAGIMALCREPADEWTSRWKIEQFCVRENKRYSGIGTEMLHYALCEVCRNQPVAVHVHAMHARQIQSCMHCSLNGPTGFYLISTGRHVGNF